MLEQDRFAENIEDSSHGQIRPGRRSCVGSRREQRRSCRWTQPGRCSLCGIRQDERIHEGRRSCRQTHQAEGCKGNGCCALLRCGRDGRGRSGTGVLLWPRRYRRKAKISSRKGISSARLCAARRSGLCFRNEACRTALPGCGTSVAGGGKEDVAHCDGRGGVEAKPKFKLTRGHFSGSRRCAARLQWGRSPVWKHYVPRGSGSGEASERTLRAVAAAAAWSLPAPQPAGKASRSPEPVRWADCSATVIAVVGRRSIAAANFWSIAAVGRRSIAAVGLPSIAVSRRAARCRRAAVSPVKRLLATAVGRGQIAAVGRRQSGGGRSQLSGGGRLLP